jgi:hypothetical protein
MRRAYLIVLCAFFAGSTVLSAQTSTPTPPPPQSARQALIEMFFGKGDNDFVKHLPEDARKTLIRKGETPETSMVLKISTMGRQLVAQGGNFETFDTGPTLLLGLPNDTEKVELNVEHDSLIGENDEIELSVHYYKNGQLQSLPVVPRLTFTFQQEKEIWRLTELTAAAHVPLTDPDYLKGVRKQQDEASEAQATMRLNVIAGAERNYLAKHPDLGYSCSLPSLFARDPSAEPGENGVFDPGQGSDEWNGYRFALTGCEGNPPSKYRISAVPTDADAGMKTFCSDESGTMKFVVGEKTSTCFSRGNPLSSGGEGTD